MVSPEILPDRPEDLQDLERQIEREWWWINGACQRRREFAAAGRSKVHHHDGKEAPDIGGLLAFAAQSFEGSFGRSDLPGVFGPRST
jgi:hypothetical protein